MKKPPNPLLLTDREARPRLAGPIPSRSLASDDMEPHERAEVIRRHVEHEAAAIKRRLNDPFGSWHVDPLASQLPWRIDIAAPLDDEQRGLSVRLGVLRAWEAGRDAESRRRGLREVALLIRRGDPLFDGQRLPDLLAECDPSTPHGLMLRLAAEAAAIRLGIELDGGPGDADRLRDAAAGEQHEGRAAEVELRAVIESLAAWWWRNMGRRPEARENPARRPDRGPTFVRFATTAALDVWRTQTKQLALASVIRTTVQAMAKDGRFIS